MCYTGRVPDKEGNRGMSQNKVEQRKYEKKHRQEILKKERRRKLFARIAAIVVIAGIVGGIAGVKIYDAIPKYVDAAELSDYVQETWQDNGYDSILPASSTDAASGTDAE